nr:hypothetical protein [Tanacetum cinerariifolium]
HQAPRAWYATLSTFLEKSGYRREAIDKTLFIKKDKKDIMLVQVYVDDIIFGSTKKSWCDEFEELMNNSMKTASTPIETQKPLVKDEEAADVDVHLYRSMIGSLMYLTASRSDIMFAVRACSRFQVTPKTSHLHDVKRIFRYLKGKPKLGLWYPNVSSFDLEAFSDSDYAGANLDMNSITGGYQFLGRRIISWQCKKQTNVASFTTEAEYVAATHCCGQNPVFHSKTKHIEIRHHFIRNAYEKKLIQVLRIHTDDNVADLLTKAFDVSSKELASLKQTVLGKDISNLLMAGRFPKTTLLTSTPLSTVGSSIAFNDGELSYPGLSKYALPDDPSMPHLEDIYANPSKGIFTDSSYDDEGVVTDFNNLETTMSVSLTPTTRIHTIHPKT